jgi:queuine tRNA-ribosyltransferase
MNDFFKVLHNSKKSKARLGQIKTPHGIINTPSFVAVGTKGTVKALTPSIVKDIGTQVAFVNTYHLVTHPGSGIVEKAGGIHNYSKLSIPLMSDSGGFQVFSLAQNSRKAGVRGEEEPLMVKISEDGVKFRSTFDGQLVEFTPEKSMEYQAEIGADINMAFDECTYYPASLEYAKKAMERTHRWLERCISYRVKNPSEKQFLYGVIQGATFEDLRKESARFVADLDTPGVAIGGVSVGESKKEMREQVKWVSEYLPGDRPVHLLGVGQLDDIVDLVKYGIDTFDCVEPTRLARMGTIYQTDDREIDINKSIYKNNLEKVDEKCNCYTCNNFTKSYLHHLFKQREILGYTLSTIHNLAIMEALFAKIREEIAQI